MCHVVVNDQIATDVGYTTERMQMLEEEIAPRVIRAREMLQESLMDLVKDHPIESIAVKEITDRAGLSRNTFYTHYQDTYHLPR